MGLVKSSGKDAAKGSLRGTPIREQSEPQIATALTVAMVSAGGLVFEIALTRIFSLYFQYHFAFLAVSLAVFGLSLGATWAYLSQPAAPSGKSPRKPARVLTLPVLLSLVSLALLIAAAGIALLPLTGSIAPQTILGIIPFILIGRFMATIFARDATSSGRLYAADLIGAAFGVFAIMALLTLWSPFTLVIALALLLGLWAALLVLMQRQASQATQIGVGGVAALGVVMLLFNLISSTFDFNPTALTDPPRDKTMLTILQDPAQHGRIVRTAWSPFSRVDLVETTDATSKYIFTDGGAGSYMMKYNGNPADVAFLKDAPEYLPFSAVPATRTLILGAGGGKDIVMARLANAQQIVALEINPVVASLTREYASYNGNILDLPQVETHIEDARTFAERTPGQFDLIYLNLVYTQAAAPANQALIENYIFTREAFGVYLNRLKPGGHLAIVTHNALEGSRAALTALAAMQDAGIPPSKALDHMLLWMVDAQDASLSTSLLLVGKDPLTTGVLQTIEAGAKAQGMKPLFSPVTYETLFAPLRKGGTLEHYVQSDADYDLSPTTDDHPYFFNLDPGLPQPVLIALIMAVVLAVGILALTLFQPATTRPRIEIILYASFIGVGFMLVEVPLIQRFGLLLGQPELSIATVLGALLISGGLGSLISQHWQTTSLPRLVPLAALWIFILALGYRLFLPSVVNALLGAALPVRILAVIILTGLLGLPMGVPFPSLLRLVNAPGERVALVWALNGGMSVLGSILALAISMVWGFSWALLVGAALYLAVAGVVRMMKVA